MWKQATSKTEFYLLVRQYNLVIPEEFWEVVDNNQTKARILEAVQSNDFEDILAVLLAVRYTDVKGRAVNDPKETIKQIRINKARQDYNQSEIVKSIQNNEYTAVMTTEWASREACSHLQGKVLLVVPREQAPAELQHLPSLYDYGYGTAGGTLGKNCRHKLYAGSYNNQPKPPAPEVAKARQDEIDKEKAKERWERERDYRQKIGDLLKAGEAGS